MIPSVGKFAGRLLIAGGLVAGGFAFSAEPPKEKETGTVKCTTFYKFISINPIAEKGVNLAKDHCSADDVLVPYPLKVPAVAYSPGKVSRPLSIKDTNYHFNLLIDVTKGTKTAVRAVIAVQPMSSNEWSSQAHGRVHDDNFGPLIHYAPIADRSAADMLADHLAQFPQRIIDRKCRFRHMLTVNCELENDASGGAAPRSQQAPSPGGDSPAPAVKDGRDSFGNDGDLVESLH